MKAELLARYADRPLPRYTSYPTAPHFAPLGPETYRDWLSAVAPASDASLYLHLPFCRSMCGYCGCHTTVTARDEPIARYVDALHREIDMVADALPGRISARHIHFGGGTPTLIKPSDFIALMDFPRDMCRIRSSSATISGGLPRATSPPERGAPSRPRIA